MTDHPRPWRKDSIFGAGPRRALDREQRSRFRFLSRAHYRAGRLTAKQLLIAESLLARLGADGQCDPSHETLAEDAGACARTVERALEQLRQLGLVLWQRRIVRAGWRVAQTSNAYVLALPGNPPENRPRACDRQTVGQTVKQVLVSVAEPALRATNAALSRVAERRQAAFAQTWLAKKGAGTLALL